MVSSRKFTDVGTLETHFITKFSEATPNLGLIPVVK